MKLPKIDLPIYQTTMPSTGKVLRYRAFTVKEEKIMLVAKESGDPEQVILSIKQILNNCIVDAVVDDMAVFDIEYVLTLIRSKSINNVVEFTIKDPDTLEDVKLQLNLDEVAVHKDPMHTNKIRLNDEFVMYMKYPSYDMYMTSFKTGAINDPLEYYNVMVSCIDQLVSADTAYKFSEFSREEVDAFIEDLSGDVIEKLQRFFTTMPKLRHTIPYTNSLGNQKKFVIEGTDSFFM